MLARLAFAWVAFVVSLACVLSCSSAVSPLPRAALLMDRGQAEEASRLLRNFLVEHPDAIRERRLLIRVEAFRGQFGEVQQQVQLLARQLGPDSPVPFIELGHALEVAHRYDEALDAYDQAGVVAPRHALGPRTGGLRAARWGELEAAEPRLVEALRRESRDAEVWHALGVVRLARGDTTGAEKAYASGLLADPKALENRVGLATCALTRRDMQAALRQYDAILAQRPRLADAQLGRSYALINLGRYREAELALDRAERDGADRRVIAAQRLELRRRTSPHLPRREPAHATP